MPESQLKQLKANLRAKGLTGPRNVKAKKKGDELDKAKKQERNQAVSKLRDVLNPFDRKVNKQKQEVLGRSVEGAAGKPGMTKQYHEQTRKQAYDAQKRYNNKAGGFRDRRFGENDSSMTEEDKMLARFTKERQSRSSNKSLFDLEDDDAELSLFGQTLSTQDDFDDYNDIPRSDDEEPEVVKKRRRMTEQGEETVEDDSVSQPPVKKSKNEVMKEVIAKSKFYKLERQKTNQEVKESVDELDDSNNDIRDLIREINRSGSSQPQEDQDKTYNRTLQELQWEPRAAPASRTKTEEEIAEEERARKTKLENRRLARMRGEIVEDSDEEEDGDDNDNENDVPEDADAAHEFGLNVNAKSGAGPESEESEDADEEDDFGDILDTAQEEDEESDISDEEQIEGNNKESKSKTSRDTGISSSCPQSLHELQQLLGDQEIEVQPKAISKMFKDYHPSKAEGNKEKQAKLMTVVVEHLLFLTDQGDKLEIVALNKFTDLIRKVSESYATPLASYFQLKLKNVHEKVTKYVEGNSKTFLLARSDLLLFTLIGLFFSTSDHYHLVCTPATLIICQYLSQTSLESLQDLYFGVYLCNVILSYQRLSQRYIPEVPLFMVRAIKRLSKKNDPRSKLSFKFEELKGVKLRDVHLKEISDPKSQKALKPLMVLKLNVLVSEFARLWKDKTSFIEIFEPLLALIEPFKDTNKVVADTVDKLQRFRKFSRKERVPLTLQSHKPIAIASHLPKFEDNYNPDKKSYDDDATRKEIKKLQREMKEEKKSALKELRRDAAFQAREQISEKREFYKKYHKDLSKLYDQIQTEEGAEKNKYEREKAARKRNNRS